MPTLQIFVDYDNVEKSLTRAGPVSLAKTLVGLVPEVVLNRHDSVAVRLYGGWREQGILTRAAQKLVPNIRAGSPLTHGKRLGMPDFLRITVELADSPIGSTTPLQETLVRERGLRGFRARSSWSECNNPASCGLGQFVSISHRTNCTTAGCTSSLANVLVRDEQKMVDTMIVADMAHQALTHKATDIVIVSSDTDMWPGVLLAVRANCQVTHIHTRARWRTQRHLIVTLGRNSQYYKQLSV